MTTNTPHGLHRDRRDNLLAALNDGPATLTGWPRFDQDREQETTP